MTFDGTNDLVKTGISNYRYKVMTEVKISDNQTNYTGILGFCDGTSRKFRLGITIY